MRNIFAPTGTVIYLGTHTELANVIYGLRGKLDNNGQFHCYIAVPGRKQSRGISFVIIRNRMSFQFRGNVSPSGENLKITYKVYPAYPVLLIIILAYALLRFFVGQTDSLAVTLATCGTLFVLGSGIFLLMRHFAIRRFVKIMEEDEEDFEGIFE